MRLRIREKRFHPIVFRNEFQIHIIIGHREQGDDLCCRENIFIRNFQVIRINEVVDTEKFFGIEKENFLEENQHGSANPEAIWFCNDEEIKISGFIKIILRERTGDAHTTDEWK